MDKVERAYTILRLKPGASLKDVIEARDDLLFLWDPRRLSERPSLRSKAAQQRREIQEAADVLLEELSHEDGGEEASTQSTPRSSTSTSPSLYEEVFSKKAQKKIPWLTLAVIGAVAFSLLWALLLLIGPEDSADPAASGATPPGESSPEQPEEAEEEQSPSQESPPSPEGTGSDEAPTATSESPTDTVQSKAEPPANRTASQTQPSTSRPESDSQPSDTRPVRANRPVLLRGPEPEPGNPATNPQSASAPEPQATAENDAKEQRNEAEAEQQLFDFLLESSRAARMLAGGRFEDLPFSGWELRDEQNGESYLDLKVDQRGTTVHFIWGVDPDQKKVRPLSQAARDLENRIP